MTAEHESHPYELVDWDAVPINSIVIGLEQKSEEVDDGDFRNLYFRKSKEFGCFLGSVYLGEPSVYSISKPTDWKILQSNEADSNEYKQVIILTSRGSLEDDSIELDHIVAKYFEHLEDQETTIAELHDKIELYKGTSLIEELCRVIIEFGKRQKKKTDIRPKLSIVKSDLSIKPNSSIKPPNKPPKPPTTKPKK